MVSGSVPTCGTDPRGYGGGHRSPGGGSATVVHVSHRSHTLRSSRSYALRTIGRLVASVTPPSVTETAATRALDAAGIDHEVRVLGPVSSLEEAAAAQGIAPGQLLKTLVLRRSEDEYLFVLIPGDRQLDWPKLRAHLGVSRVTMPSAEEALEATGYERGTITPFGSRTAWPVVADAGVHAHSRVALGSGARGQSVQLAVDDLITALDAEVADIAG